MYSFIMQQHSLYVFNDRKPCKEAFKGTQMLETKEKSWNSNAEGWKVIVMAKWNLSTSYK